MSWKIFRSPFPHSIPFPAFLHKSVQRKWEAAVVSPHFLFARNHPEHVCQGPSKCRSIRKWFIFGLFPLRFVTNLRNDSIIHYSSGRVSLASFLQDFLPFELDFSAVEGGDANLQQNEVPINLSYKVFQSKASSSVTSPRDELGCSTFGWISLHFDWGGARTRTKSGIIFLRRINFHQSSFFFTLKLKVARRIIYVYCMFGGCLAGNWLEMYYSEKSCCFATRLTPSSGESCRGNSRFVCDNRLLSAGRFTAMISRKRQTRWTLKAFEWFRVCFSFAIQPATLYHDWWKKSGWKKVRARPRRK